MIVHIVAGGPKDFLPDLRDFDGKDVYWIGVDKGVAYLFEHGLVPRTAVGDFDSLPPSEWRKYKEKIPDIKTFPPEKDKTDMELAVLEAMGKHPEKLRIFGATGGRMDHFLGNVFLICRYLRENTPVEMIDKQNIIEWKPPGRYRLDASPDKPYVSFLPLSPEVKGLSLEGFKYPLKNGHISFGSTLCISNELIGDSGTYSFTEGILLVIRSSDRPSGKAIFGGSEGKNAGETIG